MVPPPQQADRTPAATAPASVVAAVLAGARSREDTVAAAEGVATKVFADIAGVPMLQRVLEVMLAVTGRTSVYLSGPEHSLLEATSWLAARVERGEVAWQPPQDSPALSAAAVVERAFAAEPAPAAVLLTTGDHPLLSVSTAERFVVDALAAGTDVAVGLARHAEVQAAFPGSRRTALKLADGPFCGCNLFLIRTDRGRAVLDLWRQLETDRKRPLRMAATLGSGMMLRYLTGRLTSASVVGRLEALTGASVAVVPVTDPDAAVDVDSLADLATVRARWQVRSA